MTHIFDPKEMAKLDNPERSAMLPAKTLLMKCGLKTADYMLDFGAGTGFFAIPASSIVGPEGMIYAVDISELMLMELSKRVQEKRIRNIVFILEDGNPLPIEDKSIDFILLAFVFHEFEYREIVLKELRRVLKRFGKIVIFEWKKIKTEKGPPVEDRIDEVELNDALEKAGFTVQRVLNLNDSHYGVVGNR